MPGIDAERDIAAASQGGVKIAKGTSVNLCIGAANRDPDQFDTPNVFDIARMPNRHVAFAYGPHRCLGSHLARREVVIGLEEWLARIGPFRVKEGTVPMTFGGFVFGVSDLVLEWD